MRAVDLTLSVGILRVKSPKIWLEHPRIEHWYISRWRVSEWFSDKGESLKNSLWAWRERWNRKEAISGRRETPTRPFHEFDLAKATPMPRTSVDIRCMNVSHSLAISCKALHVCRYSLMKSRLYFVSCTPTIPTPLYTRKSVQTHPQKWQKERECLSIKAGYTSIYAYTT